MKTKFKNIKIGLKKNYSFKITDKIHNDFAKISGDYSPIHQDLKFIKKNKFKKKIGYAFLLTVFLSKIYGMKFPGGNELCLKQICNFKLPFYVGDTLTYQITVISKNNANKLITAAVKVYNQKNKCIFEGSTLLQIKF